MIVNNIRGRYTKASVVWGDYSLGISYKYNRHQNHALMQLYDEDHVISMLCFQNSDSPIASKLPVQIERNINMVCVHRHWSIFKIKFNCLQKCWHPQPLIHTGKNCTPLSDIIRNSSAQFYTLLDIKSTIAPKLYL